MNFDGPIALAAGGTGGHLFPAEALAQELNRRGHKVLLVTDARGSRYAANFPADERFEISAATPSIGGPVAKVTAALSIAGGLFTSLREFKKRKPSAAVGFGGYPSLPAMKAAELMKIPYGVHEQNGVLGRANRLLVKGAHFTAHAFPVLEKLPAGVLTMEVGNPVRDAVAALEGVDYPSLDGKINVLIFGGSQGASIFSEAPVKAIASLPEALRQRLVVTHQARESEMENVKAAYDKAGVKSDVAPFFADLPQRMAAAHLVLSRAGASTVTELAAIGRPSILVPLGIAMDDHQTGNARTLKDKNAAVILPEKEINEYELTGLLEALLTNPQRLKSMAAAAKGAVKSGAAARLADLVENIVAQ
ncbi:undecaprenyldiphospho-muramoylpentapeptide beta-N-acetylglucosaminyltransferase [Hyphococcus flavus]|uniref:UDP-N-acetylglucosamine--N-acetylmuramyl-(pentapeptide) pyrophosphoryl-undecaprenol N-acetylglucosamine transferase n=1 Tax=Hyphococcus flavus TaxID=1866326 RepID=A0AAE9ZA85_9PROT|nr:undecaprenyldiphospho-muramoylpentapeptide beta-N-acetylglucosaminyltransferase [Hyphococcus flavus]WDI30394.1 undecaprenyldiphospho-muramoylpentapeptide beta-N-acetylglucosaminyltransferase [Hyphococcus flavus]